MRMHAYRNCTYEDFMYDCTHEVARMRTARMGMSIWGLYI